MKSLFSRNLDIRETGGSLQTVRKAAAELLVDVARFVGTGDMDTPGAIVFRVKRGRFDCQVTAEIQPFDPAEHLE